MKDRLTFVIELADAYEGVFVRYDPACRLLTLLEEQSLQKKMLS